MTRDEILALTGPELDAAVATEVMGWEHGHASPDWWWDGPTERYTHPRCTWQPHLRWDHAGEVVEAMRAKGYDVILEMFAPHESDAPGKFHFHAWADSDLVDCPPDVNAPGHTAPEAICRAALLAMLAERSANQVLKCAELADKEAADGNES